MSELNHEDRSIAGVFYARSFLGRKDDLDLDFDHMVRPVLITSLLANCLSQENRGVFTESEIWQWSLKKRLQALLAVVVASSGDQLIIEETCAHHDCRKTMELNIDLSVFESNWQEEKEVFSSRPNESDTVLQVRLPRGIDQLQWLNKSEITGDNDRWFTEMATDLVTMINGREPEDDWCVPADWIDTISEDLEDNDTLTCLQISTDCPFCQKTFEIPIDLEARLLAVLASLQKQMFRNIHRLASVYHWSETEIMALSPRRRNYYLRKIEEGSST